MVIVVMTIDFELQIYKIRAIQIGIKPNTFSHVFIEVNPEQRTIPEPVKCHSTIRQVLLNDCRIVDFQLL